MEKRLTLAIVLTVIFLIAYQQLVLKKYVPPPKKAATTESVVVRTSPAPAQTTVNEPAPLSTTAIGEAVSGLGSKRRRTTGRSSPTAAEPSIFTSWAIRVQTTSPRAYLQAKRGLLRRLR